MIRIKPCYTTGYTREYQYEGVAYRVSSSFQAPACKGERAKSLKSCFKSALLKDAELTNRITKATITSSEGDLPVRKES